MGILGMAPCDGTDAVPPNARSHTVLLAGTLIGDAQACPPRTWLSSDVNSSSIIEPLLLYMRTPVICLLSIMGGKLIRKKVATQTGVQCLVCAD